jgi:prepilin-type N-terminal cleavage/methylation domain-containing protein
MLTRLKRQKGKSKGFTIVELLIVVVIMGILAAIVVLAYTNVTNRARNNSRVSEMKSWVRLFESYRALNGSLPPLTTGFYCLGTGFPSTPGGGNVPRCRDYDTTGATSYLETTGSGLITALSTVGRIPKADKNGVNNTVGPYLDYAAGWGSNITGWFNGNSAADCPAGTVFGWGDGVGRIECHIFLAE